MQQASFQQVIPIQFQSQATRVLPGHGTGMYEEAVNDDVYFEEYSPVRMVFSVLANVIGGVLLLSALFVLPHVLAGFIV
jgi:hypothetical protein